MSTRNKAGAGPGHWIKAALLLASLSLWPVAAPSAQTMRLGHMWPTTSTWGQAIEQFAQLVNQKTGGRYRIQVFPDGQLGNERENEESLRLGTLEFTFGGPGVLGGFDPRIGLFDMPFLFRDYEHANAVMDGPIGKELFDVYRQATGIRILASAAQGFRFVMTRRTAINTVQDLAGLKIRTPEAETFIRAFRAMGANPVPVPFGETYLALQSGVVDGIEGTPAVMRDFKFYEVGRHVAQTMHIMATLQLLVSDTIYAKLPAETRAAIDAAAVEAWGNARRAAQAENEQATNELVTRHGVTMTRPDMAPTRNALQSYWREWGTRTNSLKFIEAVQSMQ